MNTNCLKITGVFIVILFSYSSMYTKSACIIVHGTWAQNETWYRPAGDFFEAVKSCNQEINMVDDIVSFSWSGKLGRPAQIEAAQKLVKMIEQYSFVILVAHSHGATVGMIASDIIEKTSTDRNNFHKIEKFYALGVPVDEAVVTPNYKVIKKFYNLFSFGDLIQPVNGICGRIFTAHHQLANISIQLCGAHPSHVQLHHPAIGMYILKIETFFSEKSIGGFDKFSFSVPGCIHFFLYRCPLYQWQMNQMELLMEDKRMQELATYAFFRGRPDPESID